MQEGLFSTSQIQMRWRSSARPHERARVKMIRLRLARLGLKTQSLGYPASSCRSGLRSDGNDAGRLRQVHRRRNREVGQNNPGGKHQAGVVESRNRRLLSLWDVRFATECLAACLLRVKIDRSIKSYRRPGSAAPRKLTRALTVPTMVTNGGHPWPRAVVRRGGHAPELRHVGREGRRQQARRRGADEMRPSTNGSVLPPRSSHAMIA
jgi:hypothetical protein